MYRTLLFTLCIAFTSLAAKITLPQEPITESVIFSDTICLDSTIEIDNDAVVTLLPGTVVIANSMYGGFVPLSGTIVAVGTSEDSIRFENADSIQHSGGIIVKRDEYPDAVEPRFEYCHFSGSIAGVNILGDSLKPYSFSIKNCTFEDTKMSGVIVKHCDLIVDSCEFIDIATDTVLSSTMRSAVHVERGSLTLTNSLFHGNRTGAVCVMGYDATIENCTFDSQISKGLMSAGIYLFNVTDTSEITGCTFANCIQSDSSGGTGAINISVASAPVTICNSTFDDIYGPSAGGIYASDIQDLTIHNVVMNSCSTQNRGGAIGLSRIVNGIVNNCTIEKSSAGVDGGGLHIDQCTLTVANSDFNENSAVYHGGGIYATLSNVTVKMSQFDNNRNALYCDIGDSVKLINLVVANDSLCGLAVHQLRDTVELINSTFYGNYRDIAAYSTSLLHAVNTLFWQTGDVVLYNSVGKIPAGVRFENCFGENDQSIDPHMIDPVGGNYRLKENSPCIDRGESSWADYDTDLAAFQRISGESVDIGAFEFQSDDVVVANHAIQGLNRIYYSNGKLHLRGIAHKGTVSLYSHSGRVVWASPIDPATADVLIPNEIARGTYLLKVETGDKIQVAKLAL